MTRPTNFRGTGVPIILHALGYDPEEVTPEIPPPTDRALSSNGAYAFTVSTPVTDDPFVQQAYANGSSSARAVFSTAPTVGNTIVALGWRRDSGEPTNTMTGFTTIAMAEDSIGFQRSVGMLYHVVQADETPYQYVTNGYSWSTVNYLAIVELDGTYDSIFAERNDVAATTVLNAGGAVTPDAATDAIIVGLAAIYGNHAGGVTEDTDVLTVVDEFTGGFSPYKWAGYRVVEDASGSYTVGGTMTSDHFCGVTAVFAISAPTEPAWDVEAPRTIDGDDVTYHEIDGPDVLRIDLGAAFDIVSSRLLMGSQFAGSVTYRIRGANAADFSDGIELVSKTFDVTGSYTADEIEFVWLTTEAYQYFELTGTDENRRVYTWSLYEADIGLGQDHDHGALQQQIDDLAESVEPLIPLSTITPTTGDVLTWGGAEWAPRENVRRITADGSNTLLGPFVNFAAGSNISFTFDGASIPSNTLRIHGSAGGGGSALTVQESDGSPSDSAVTKLIFPDNSLSISGHEVTIRDVPQAFIGCSVAGTSTSLTTATVTPLAFNSTDIYDTDGFHDPSSNNTRLTIPAGLGGKYLLTARSSIPNVTNASSERRLGYRIDGGANQIMWRSQVAIDTSATTGYVNESVVVDLAAGQYIEVTLQITNATSPQTATDYYAQLTKLDSGKVGQGIGARAITNATFDLTTSVEAAVPFAGTDDFDTDGFHDPASNNTRLTIPAGLGGTYLIGGFIAYTANTTGDRYAKLRKNGTTDLGYQRQTALDDAALASIVSVNTVAQLVAGDYVELMAFQDSGGSTVDATSAAFWIARLDSGTGAGAWTTYTPTWAGSGSNPSLGNGTLTGLYKKLDGTLYLVSITLSIGSTTTFGSGNYSFSLPSEFNVGAAFIESTPMAIDVSAGSPYFPLTARLSGSPRVIELRTFAAPALNVTPTVPFTWADGDQIGLLGIVRVA